jgi:hypothetical protein
LDDITTIAPPEFFEDTEQITPATATATDRSCNNHEKKAVSASRASGDTNTVAANESSSTVSSKAAVEREQLLSPREEEASSPKQQQQQQQQQALVTNPNKLTTTIVQKAAAATLAEKSNAVAMQKKKAPEMIETKIQSLHSNHQQEEAVEKQQQQQHETTANETLVDPVDSDDSGVSNASDHSDESDDSDDCDEDGPWWKSAENQHKLEDWIMGKFDAIITKAERKEERDIMDYWDEKIMMHQLLHDIERATTDRDKIRKESKKNPEGPDSPSCSSSSSNRATAIHGGTEITETEQSVEEEDANVIFPEPENLEPNSGSPATPMEVEFEKEKEKEPPIPYSNSDYRDMGIKVMTKIAATSTEGTSSTTVIRRALPKWVPNRSGNNAPDAEGPLVRLFTIQEFDSHIVQPLIHMLSHHPFHIRILEDWKNDCYLLEVTAPSNNNKNSTAASRKKAWNRIRATTDAFVRSKVAMINARRILEDGASLEIDLVLSTKEPLGMSFSKFNLLKGGNEKVVPNTDTNHDDDCLPGLWIKRVLPDKGLANVMGSHTIFNHGCVLLSVDRNVIQHPKQLQNLLKVARADTRRAHSPSMSIKICLSKHSDLRGVPHPKLLKSFRLRRRDGKTLDPNAHPGLSGKKVPTLATATSAATSAAKSAATSAATTVTVTTSKAEPEAARMASKAKVPPRLGVSAAQEPLLPAAKRVRDHHESSETKGNDKSNSKKDEKESKDNHPSNPAFIKSTRPLVQQQHQHPQGRQPVASATPPPPPHSKISESSMKPSGGSHDTTDKPKEAKAPPSNPPRECNIENSDGSISTVNTNISSNRSTVAKTAADSRAGNEPLLNLEGEYLPTQHVKETKPSTPNPSSSGNITSNSDKGLTTKVSVSRKPVGDNSHATQNSQEKVQATTQSNITVVSKNEKASAEDKPKPKPVNNTHQTNFSGANNTNVQIGISATTTTASPKSDEARPLSEPISDRNKIKSIEGGSQRHIESRNSKVLNNNARLRDDKAKDVGVLSGISEEEDGNDPFRPTSRKVDSSATTNDPVAKEDPKASKNSTRNVDGISRNTPNNVSKPHSTTNTTRVQTSTPRGNQLQQQQSEYSDSRWKGRCASSHFDDHFEVALDSKRPLGGYFRTERGQNPRSKCLLISKHGRGQLANDRRIKIGTQVTAVMVGERRMVVSDHVDLVGRYSDAKEHRKNLRLILQNNHSCRIETAHVSSRNWDRRGMWIGNETTGWAGGASSFRSGSLVSSNERNDKGRWTNQKMPSLPSSPRMAPFSPSYIDVDGVRLPNAPALLGEDYIIRIIRTKSMRELIDFLETGPDLSKEYLQQVLQSQYHYVRTELNKLNYISSEGETNSFQKPMWERLECEQKKQQRQAENAAKIEDLEAKKKILKLYINSAHLIEKAMTLRSWTEVLIDVTSIELFHLPLESFPGRSRVISAKVQTKSPDADLRHLQVEPMRRQIFYEPDNEVSMHNNHNMSLENRKVVVEISEGDPKLDVVQPKNLGEFVLALNEIEKQW